jgi:hypothetical protein
VTDRLIRITTALAVARLSWGAASVLSPPASCRESLRSVSLLSCFLWLSCG